MHYLSPTFTRITACGTVLPRLDPRMTRDVSRVNCVGCLANITGTDEWKRRQEGDRRMGAARKGEEG